MLKQKMFEAIVFRILNPLLTKTIRIFFSHGNCPFYESSEAPDLRPLEDHWKILRQELDVLMLEKSKIPGFHEISKEQLPITNDDRWKTFFFWAYGQKIEKNCARCPKTAALLETIPRMTTAMFSILSGNKHIPPHRGPFKGVLRYHLALWVPKDRERCRIRVGKEIAHWQEGKALLFDDTHEHEVWNDTPEDRVVLFLDLLRPLPFPFSMFNRFVMRQISKTSFIQDSLRNLHAWKEPA